MASGKACKAIVATFVYKIHRIRTFMIRPGCVTGVPAALMPRFRSMGSVFRSTSSACNVTRLYSSEDAFYLGVADVVQELPPRIGVSTTETAGPNCTDSKIEPATAAAYIVRSCTPSYCSGFLCE